MVAHNARSRRPRRRRPPALLAVLAALALAASLALSSCALPNPFALGRWLGGKGAWDEGEPAVGRADIRDEQGRVVVYHGLSIANTSKYRPGNLPWQGQAELRRMRRDWGFNLVRLLVFWMAIEPAEGDYQDQAGGYIEGVLDFIALCRDEGIDVVVDFHKDVYGSKFGDDGFPAWATEDDGLVFDPPPDSFWSDNYMEPAVRRAFRNFWNSPRLKGKYLAMAAKLLAAIDAAGLGGAIAGVDAMNEPFPHELDALGPNPWEAALNSGRDLASVREFERNYLGPFYGSFAGMMESHNLPWRIWYEPWISTSAGIPSFLDWPARPGDVYAPHFYYNPGTGEASTEGYPGALGRRYVQVAVAQKAFEAKDHGSPMVLAEFGVDDRRDGSRRMLSDLLSDLDRAGSGWCYYVYDKIGDSPYGVVNDDLSDRTATLSILVRPYPMRIAGSRARWAIEGDSLVLDYEASGGAAPTELWVPESLAGAGARLRVDGEDRSDLLPADAAAWEAAAGIVAIGGGAAARRKVELSW